MVAIPSLSCFRVDISARRVAHLVFDMPGRSANVLTASASREIGALAAWLRDSDVAGAVVSSGKRNFCVGGDLVELGAAYAEVLAAPRDARMGVASERFSPLGRALRGLETSGKPVAAAVSGLALGGGFEFALGCHHRVLADTPRTALGLPEALVGLMPGAGGTQRLPRLVGVAAALPVLLRGERLGPEAALRSGAADAVVPAGEEVAAAERWVLECSASRQPWDAGRSGTADGLALDAERGRVLGDTHGHLPALPAILDCVERGIGAPMDRALAVELDAFCRLIQRPEPRNMIDSLFLAKAEFERRSGDGTMQAAVGNAVAAARVALRSAAAGMADAASALAFAGFADGAAAIDGPAPPAFEARVAPVEEAGEESAGLWFERDALPGREARALGLLLATVRAVEPYASVLDAGERRLADHASVVEMGFPAYLGGPFALRRYLGHARLRRLAAQVGRT